MFYFASPITAIAIFYGIFIVPSLAYRLITGHDDRQVINEYMLSDALREQALMLLIALVTYTILQIRKAKRLEFIDPQRDLEFSIDGRKACRAVLVFIFILLTIGVLRGANPLSDPLRFRQAIQNAGAAYFLLAFLFFMRLYGIFFFDSFMKKTLKIKDYLFLLLVIAFCFLSGFSSLFVYVFLAGMIYVSNRYGARVIGPSTIALAAIVILLAPVYTYYRTLAFEGIKFDFQQFVQDFLGSFDEFSVTLFNRFDYLDNFSIGSFVAKDRQSLLYIADFFLQPIPRSLFEAKPPNFSTLMTQWIYPENIENGVTANYGFMNEFILYFGQLGIVVSGIFLGFLTNFMYKKYLVGTRSAREAVKYNVVWWPYLFLGLIAGYYNDLALPALIIDFVLYKFSVRKKIIR